MLAFRSNYDLRYSENPISYQPVSAIIGGYRKPRLAPVIVLILYTHSELVGLASMVDLFECSFGFNHLFIPEAGDCEMLSYHAASPHAPSI